MSWDTEDWVVFSSVCVVLGGPLLWLATWLLIALLGGCGPQYAEGTQTGIVTSVEYTGVLWKAYATYLHPSGGRKQQGAMSTTVLVFTVKDPAVREALEAAARSGDVVQVHYTQWLVAPMRNVGSCVVDKVEVLP